MEEIGELPPRVIAADEEPRGDRINVYQKIEIIRVLRKALDEEEYDFMRASSLGKLFEIPSKPAWSGTFGLYLLSRQLQTTKENEMWVVFAGYPIRFSLREFKIVTGLPCGKYPPKEKKRRKGNGGQKESYFKTLFGTLNDITVDRVLHLLKKRTPGDRDTRLRLAALVLVDGILVPTTHFPKCKIIEEHAEMVEDLECFLAYPWGRLSFDMIMNSLKERDLTRSAAANVAIQGFIHALQMVLIEAVPDLEEGAVAGDGSETDSSGGVIQIKRQRFPLNLKNAREIDEEGGVRVTSIIRPELVFDAHEEDLTWTDDEDDPRVENMLKLINQGFEFKDEMFVGGSQLSQPVGKALRKKTGTGKQGGRKSKKLVRQLPGSKRSRPHIQERDEHVSTMLPLGEEEPRWISALENRISSVIEKKLVKKSKEDESNLRELIKAELQKNNDAIIQGFIRWFTDNTEIEIGGTSTAKAHTISETAPPKTTHPNNVSTTDEGQKADTSQNDISGFCSVRDVAGFYAPGGEDRTGNPLTDAGAGNEDTERDKRSGEGIEVSVGNVYDGNVRDGMDDEEGEEISGDGSSHDLESDEGRDGMAQGAGDANVEENLVEEEGTEFLLQNEYISTQGLVESGVLNPGYSEVVASEVNQSQPSVEGGVLNPGLSEIVQNEDEHLADNAVRTATAAELKPPLPEPIIAEAPCNKDDSLLDNVHGAVAAAEGDPPSMEPNQSETNVEQEDATASVAAEGVAVRKSKRARTVTSRDINSPFCNKRMKTGKCDNGKEEIYQRLKSLKTSVKLGSNISLTPKELTDFVGREKHVPNKVMDAFMKFARFVLRSIATDEEPLRVEVVDTKFVAQLSRLYPKFCKATKPEDFEFPTAVVDPLLCVGEGDAVDLCMDVDHLYMLFNFEKTHWVALAANLKTGTLQVLDSEMSVVNDFTVLRDIQLIAVMLPYLLKQVGDSKGGGVVDTSKLFIERVPGVPEATGIADSAVMTILLILAHAPGGIEQCKEIEVAQLDAECKQLVGCLLDTYSG